MAGIRELYGYDPQLGARVEDCLEGMSLQEDGYVVPTTPDADHLIKVPRAMSTTDAPPWP